MSRVVRVDPQVRAALDRIRNQYGDANYSEVIRRALRWHKVSHSRTSTDSLPDLRRWL